MGEDTQAQIYGNKKYINIHVSTIQRKHEVHTKW